MNEIEVSLEAKRGCGFRKSGPTGVGIYLVGDGMLEPCPRLPFPLTVCPCCGAGVKFSRGFTWIAPSKLFDPKLPPVAENHSLSCPLCQPRRMHPDDNAGLMWVGNKYYSPQSFMREAQERGVCKKIAAIPNGFEIGKHFIFLAHINAVPDLSDKDNPAKPGVFMVFRPKMVDLVVEGDTVPDKALNLLEKLGDKARIVKVVRDEAEQGVLL